MPMLDACIPEGALSPEADDKLLARLTTCCCSTQGADPANPAARSNAWVLCTAPRSTRAARPLRAPLPFRCQVPEGRVAPMNGPGRHRGDDTSRRGRRGRSRRATYRAGSGYSPPRSLTAPGAPSDVSSASPTSTSMWPDPARAHWPSNDWPSPGTATRQPP